MQRSRIYLSALTAAAFVALLSTLAFGLHGLGRPGLPQLDFLAYYGAGERLLEHKIPYGAPTTPPRMAAQGEETRVFAYPPNMGPLVVPFALTSYRTARYVFNALNVIAVVAFGLGVGLLSVTSGSYASKLHTYAAEDFPRLPAADAPLTPLDAPALLETIDRVSRSASRDESRPVLTGILVRFEGSTLTMAATDSYRLAMKETSLAKPGPDLEAIIPARALTELQRITGAAETVEIGVLENHVVFTVGGVWLTTRRIDGQFPNVRQLIPETFEIELTLPRGELLDVVRRAAVMAQRNTPLRVRFAEGELTVSAQSQDVGETRETMPVPYTGEPIEIGFNADFLREGLESVPTETISLKLINPLRPGLITAEGDAFWYLIMPIRLAG